MNTTAPGNDLISDQFNGVITPVLFTILFRSQPRHPIFEWMITIMGSSLVCSGTLKRVLQIVYDTGWHAIPDEVQGYFYQSLLAWIACIIMDGRHTYKIIKEVHTNMNVVQQWKQCTRSQRLELVGVIISCASMVKFAFNVYYNFQPLTQDRSLYFWFFVAVFCKISRIFVQGLVLILDTQQLLIKDYTTHLMFSNVFLTAQVPFLAQFTPICFWSALLLLADVTYRLYQILKLACYWCKTYHPDYLNDLTAFLNKLGEHVSTVAMSKLSIDLYNSIQLHATYSFISCVKWLLLAMLIITQGVFNQGLMVTANTKRLKESEYRRQIKQQLLCGAFFTISLLFTYLTVIKTASLFSITTVSLGAHILYRFYQIWKPVYFWYRNHDTCSEEYLHKSLFIYILYRPVENWHQAKNAEQMEQQQETPQHHSRNDLAQMEHNKDDNEDNNMNFPKSFLNQFGEA